MAVVQRILLDPLDQAAIGLVQADLRRRSRVAEGVEVDRGIGREHARMRAIARADPQRRIRRAAVELEPVDLRIGDEVPV